MTPHDRSRNTLIFQATLAAALAMSSPAAAPAQHFPAGDDLSAMLRYLVDDGVARGVVFGTLEADGATRILHHGEAGPGARPLGPGSVFEVASITKVFTGILLAELAARGDVALTDPASKHLPDDVVLPTRGGHEITLLDLGTHHSGLPRDPDNHTPADPADPLADYTVERLYDFVSSAELRRDPGSEGGYEYSNVGYGLLGHVLARIGGAGYEDVLRERVLAPLGMTRTAIALAGEAADWLVAGHDRRGEPVPPWTATDALAGAGALRASGEDMLRFLVANVGPPETELEQALRTAQRPWRTRGAFGRIGLGWQLLEVDGRTIVIHDGGSRGFRASIGFDPDRRVGFFLLMNKIGPDASLGLDLLLHGPAPAVSAVDVMPDRIAGYVGQYEIEPGWLVAVEPDDAGALTLRTPTRERMRLYAASETDFYLKRLPWQVAFATGGSGQVDGLVLTIEGVDREGRRVTAESPPTPVTAEVLDLPLEPDDGARYEGTYRIRLGQTILDARVFTDGGRLMWQSGAAAPGRLLHQGGHTFVHDNDPGLRVVFAVADGRAAGVTVHQLGLVVPARRVW